MMNWKRLIGCSSLGILFLLSNPALAERITIGIGHQSMVTNTVAGGIVLEKLGLIEKYLPTDGDYADAEYEIIFRDYDSGPPITNQMMAGNLEFGVMGDYPLIVNGANFQATGRHETRFITVTGYNRQGTGNGIVVPVASDVHSLEELAGKRISTPVGSAAWGMTLKALRDAGLDGQIAIVDQSPPVGVANIAGNRIDAHADFGPWSEVMEFRGTGRKIFDGSEAGVPTFHGIVVRKAFADRYPEVVEAVLQATLEAQQWIREDPMRAATQLSEWTGVAKEVLYLYLSEGESAPWMPPSSPSGSRRCSTITPCCRRSATSLTSISTPGSTTATSVAPMRRPGWTMPPTWSAWSRPWRRTRISARPRYGSPTRVSSSTKVLPTWWRPTVRRTAKGERSTPPMSTITTAGSRCSARPPFLPKCRMVKWWPS